MMTRLCPICGKTYQDFECRTNPLRQRITCSKKCSVLRLTKPPEERFWKFVEKTESCWLWKGGIRGNQIKYGHFHHTNAHRFAWTMIKGPIPDGLFVCHDCPGGDNPLCVNPDHMFLGDGFDNLRDASKKGTLAWGERNVNAKLKLDEVRRIRHLWKIRAFTQVKMASLYNVDKTTIHKVIKGKIWKQDLQRNPG